MNGSAAFSLSLRRYSNSDPWSWLVPDLVVACIMAPEAWPNSAS